MIKFLYARRTYDDIDDEHACRVNHSIRIVFSMSSARAWRREPTTSYLEFRRIARESEGVV